MNPKRNVPIEIPPEDFRVIGHQLVDNIADFLASLPSKRVNPGESPGEVREIIGNTTLPMHGIHPKQLLDETAKLLFDHSLFNGHPSFFGYITSSAAPIGALGDFLASAVNPNVGSFQLSPVATEIEAQTVRWIAEMIGYPTDCGGLFVSGGNMANFVCFLAGRRAKIPWDIRKEGLHKGKNFHVYCSTETHTWINKAADLFGFGTDVIRWIPANQQLHMDVTLLRKQIHDDIAQGDLPLMVVGTAGSVSTGAIDPLREIAEVCRMHKLWFHIDGAYGGFAAVLPDASEDLKALSLADSVAVDPHKWLYAPLEAGCALVREKQMLLDAFSFRPPYYRFGHDAAEPPTNFFEYGLQNSRGFRALKVWLALRHVGRKGYEQMIADDIALARELYRVVTQTPELEVFTQELSITTFRYRPIDMHSSNNEYEQYLNQLNEEVLKRVQDIGEAYLSNAVIHGAFVLRACVVNFRTTTKEIHALPELVVQIGKEVHQEMKEKQSV